MELLVCAGGREELLPLSVPYRNRDSTDEILFSCLKLCLLLDSRSMRAPPILYSTASFLAYRIANEYYKDVHYAWCSPIFDGRTAPRLGPSVPPTSSPCEIYWGLHQEVFRGDRHSSKITDNRAGIVRGAQYKRKVGVIDADKEREIIEAAEAAETRDFRPLLFISPYSKVRNLIEVVPVHSRAHPLSAECLIPLLPGRFFDVIELGNPA
jgi:hypothetical protein